MRRLTLGHEGLRHLLAYLDTYRPRVAALLKKRVFSQDHLFLSETGRPLTKNGMTLLFGRLRKRSGISRKGVNPSLLREGFALRFLQTGGDPLMLQELLGYSEQATGARYQRLSTEALAQQYRMEPPETLPSTSREVLPCARRRRQTGKPLESEVSLTNPLHNDEKFFIEE
jgi:site-specific recombinase XerD